MQNGWGNSEILRISNFVKTSMIVFPAQFIRVITLKHKVMFYYEVLWNIRGRKWGVSKKFRHIACGYR
jgi:hypothetical protein